MKTVGYEVAWTTKGGRRRKRVSTLREAIDLFSKKKAAGHGSPCYHVAVNQ